MGTLQDLERRVDRLERDTVADFDSGRIVRLREFSTVGNVSFHQLSSNPGFLSVGSNGLVSVASQAALLSAIGLFSATANGLTPASGGGTTNYLRADGSWASPPGAGLSDGDRGDVVVSGSGTVWTVESAAGNFVVAGNTQLGDAGTDYVTVGTATRYNAAAQFDVSSTAVNNIGLNLFNATAGNYPVLRINRSRGATLGSYTAVTANDLLGAIAFGGSDGTTWKEGAWIYAWAYQNAAAGHMPTHMDFAPYGTSGTRSLMRAGAAGVGFGTFVAGPTTAFDPEQPIDIRNMSANWNSTSVGGGGGGIRLGTSENSGSRRTAYILLRSNSTGTGNTDWFVSIQPPANTTGSSANMLSIWGDQVQINAPTLGTKGSRMFEVHSGGAQIRMIGASAAGSYSMLEFYSLYGGASTVAQIGWQNGGGSDLEFKNKFTFKVATAIPFCFNYAGTDIAQISTSGDVVVGPLSANLTTATYPFLYIPSAAGTPTGVPSGYTGKIPLVADSTNNLIYWYSGSAWRTASLSTHSHGNITSGGAGGTSAQFLRGDGLWQDTLEGNLYFGTTIREIKHSIDTQAIYFVGGNNVASSANLQLFGQAHATYPGHAYLVARSGATVSYWQMQPDGFCGWSDNGTFTFQILATGSVSITQQLVSSLATGTAPFSVASTTVVTNLNADQLDGQHGSYYAVQGQTMYIGSTGVAINRGSGPMALGQCVLATEGSLVADMNTVYNNYTGTAHITATSGSSNTPTAGWGVALSVRRTTVGGNAHGTFQIMGEPTNNENIYIRKVTVAGNPETWSAWRIIIHSGNIGSQTVTNSTYVYNNSTATYQNAWESNVGPSIVARTAAGYIYATGYVQELTDDAQAAQAYFFTIAGSGGAGAMMRKSLANVKTEIVTAAAMNTAWTGSGSMNFGFGTSNGVTLTTTNSGLYLYNAEQNAQTLRIGAAWGKPGIYAGDYCYTMAEINAGLVVANVVRAYAHSTGFTINGTLGIVGDQITNSYLAIGSTGSPYAYLCSGATATPYSNLVLSDGTTSLTAQTRVTGVAKTHSYINLAQTYVTIEARDGTIPQSTVLQLSSAGTFTWGGNAVIHAGTIGSQYVTGAIRQTAFTWTTDWNTTFANTGAHQRTWVETNSGWGAGYPAAGWWFIENMRHSNGTNYWGRQNAWGWEENATEFYSRNVQGGTWGSWVRFLHTGNIGGATVSSTTVVTNLNADLLDGYHGSSSSTANTYVLRDANTYINVGSVTLTGGDGNGIRFWASTSYSHHMSDSTNGTYGGRISGETTSDYNMYYRIGAGTNRGHVFESSYGTKLFAINPDGVRSVVKIYPYNTSAYITGNGTGMVIEGNYLHVNNALYVTNGAYARGGLLNDQGELTLQNNNTYTRVTIANSNPEFHLYDNDGTSNTRRWRLIGGSGVLTIDGVYDDVSNYYTRGVAMNQTVFYPVIDNAMYCGAGGNRWIAVYAVNGTIQTSDEAMKRDIQPIVVGRDFIDKLRPVSYRWKEGDDERQRHGLIAQEIKKVADDCGIEFGDISEDGKGLNYAGLIGPLVKAVQELSAEVDRLKTLH